MAEVPLPPSVWLRRATDCPGCAHPEATVGGGLDVDKMAFVSTPLSSFCNEFVKKSTDMLRRAFLNWCRCTGDMLRAFHAALRNSPVNTKNQAVKVKGVELRCCWVVLGPGRERPGALDSMCLISASVNLYQGSELAPACVSTEAAWCP